jgi:acyl-CoA synthetase (AMP-forming)/AMP-acid ligase II
MLKAEEAAYVLRRVRAEMIATDSALAPLAQAAATLDTELKSFVWRWVEAALAVVVVKSGQALSETDVPAHCVEALAGFKIPKAVVFTDALPKNPSVKLLKREVRQRHGGLLGGA